MRVPNIVLLHMSKHMKKEKTQKVALWTSIDAVPLWCSKHLQETVGHCIGSVVIVFEVR